MNYLEIYSINKLIKNWVLHSK